MPTTPADRVAKFSSIIETMFQLAHEEIFSPLESFPRDHRGIRETDFTHVCRSITFTPAHHLSAVERTVWATHHPALALRYRAFEDAAAGIGDIAASAEVDISLYRLHATCACERKEEVEKYGAKVTVTWRQHKMVREYALGGES